MVKSAKQNETLFWKFKRLLSGSLFLAGMILMMTSCGNQASQEHGQAQGSDENQDFSGSSESDESASVEADEEDSRENGTDSDSGEETDGIVAVADFYYMPLNTLDLKDSANTGYYTIDREWLYYAILVNEAGEGVFPTDNHIHIFRGRISDGYQEEDYIVQPKNMRLITLYALLADGQGNCYTFWGPGYLAEEEDRFYSLEKYDSSGELLWKADYSSEELQDMGNVLNQGIVTADGRVFLYSIGKSGRIFSFDSDGSLAEIYDPELEVLDGIVSGKDGKVYGYCITKEKPVFTELGGPGEQYSCPKGILEVYDGRGSNPCVRTGKGVWSYTPETGEKERLWEWEDEYIQISGDDVDAVFRDGESFMVMCSEYRSAYSFSMNRRPLQTFASITLEERKNYPAKQRITLGTVNTDAYREILSKVNVVVRMYNRHSRKYKVEFVSEDDEYSMQMKFIQGKGTDIIDLSEVYAGNLAGIGAFEDLTAYYEASDKVKMEDILEPVREACVLAGKNVLVMPSFNILTLLSAEEEVASEKLDVWNFLERAKSEWMILYQDSMTVLEYCMGVKYGEYFVDYENRQCDFDSPEFRRILEACSKVRTEQRHSSTREDRPCLELTRLENPWDVANESMTYGLTGIYSDRIMGYPGMDGTEHRFYPESVFAMNSASANKEGAWDFLEFLMSEEMQSLISWGFPSRKDVFEQSLSDIYVSPVRTRISFIDDNGNPVENGFAKEVTDHDLAVLREVVENAKYDSWGGRLSPLWDIVADEAGMYFNGDATLDTTISKIQNRVQLYLDEQ